MAISLRDWLRAEMDSRGWSERSAAEATGVSRSTVHDILNEDDYTPSLTTLDKISKASGTPLVRLVEMCGFSANWGEEPPVSTRLARIAAAHPALAAVQERLLDLNLEDFAATLAYLEGLALRRATRDRSDEK